MDGSNPSTDDIPIDREYLSGVTGDDTEFERELAESYLQASPGLIEQLRGQITSGDAAAVQHAAHTLKGSSRAIGAEPMGAVCETLEHQARDGNLSGAEQRVEEIERRYEVLSAYIRETWSI
jgi:HPt (histidine-containing phosphotransfer) domain-containing protein